MNTSTANSPFGAKRKFPTGPWTTDGHFLWLKDCHQNEMRTDGELWAVEVRTVSGHLRDGGPTREQMEAAALLMAAAPQLLDVCERILGAHYRAVFARSGVAEEAELCPDLANALFRAIKDATGISPLQGDQE